MTTTLKRWTQLGLGAALASSTLAACSAPEQATKESESEVASAETAPVLPSTVGGEGEGIGGEGEGAGGEGEGGVAIAQAANDPVVYKSALAIAEAHIIAARDAHALGETEAAAEMFGHPVSEVLFEMQPVFAARGVEDFSGLFVNASHAVFDGETPEQVAARADEMIAALRAAADKAPDGGTSAASVSAGVAADQIERAADMYRIATESDAYGPYLDGYGFLKAGEAVFLANADLIAAEDARASIALQNAISVLSTAYPSAVKPETLKADIPTLTVAASEAVLAVSN